MYKRPHIYGRDMFIVQHVHVFRIKIIVQCLIEMRTNSMTLLIYILNL